MHINVARLSALSLSLLLLTPIPALASDDQKLTRTAVGIAVEVTAGQEFYAETALEEVAAYRLEKPFKSSMGGAMGLPFGFAIDDTLLISDRKTEKWEYFVPADGKFRAYHGLLGSVIAKGDSVGLRVNSRGGMEWFVDNSIKNGVPSLWTRKLKEKDPAVTRTKTTLARPTGQSVERLIYLGFASNGVIRVRHEHVTPSETIRDEFTFPVDQNGVGYGAVRGAEFRIVAAQLRAEITVTKAMGSGLGIPSKASD